MNDLLILTKSISGVNDTKVSVETILRLMPTLSDTTLKDVTARAYLTNGEEKSKCDFRSLEITIGEGERGESEVRTVASSLQYLNYDY
jgi:hypothetical protein